MCHNLFTAKVSRIMAQTDKLVRETLRLMPPLKGDCTEPSWCIPELNRLFAKTKKSPLSNDHGFGLIMAIFVIVIMAMFGLLTVRYVSTTSETSAEDYLWAEGLYAAESAVQLKILCRDDGGTWTGVDKCKVGTYSDPTVARFSTQVPSVTAVNDDFVAADIPATLRIRANINNLNISREIEVKYIL